MTKKILIADDSLFMRSVLRDILSDKYEIVEAETGLKATQQFEKEKPDLTLLDIIMPEGEEEGVTVLQKIREADPGARVVMITAIGQDSVMEKCKKLGVVDYIVKPFDREEIIKIAQKYLG